LPPLSFQRPSQVLEPRPSQALLLSDHPQELPYPLAQALLAQAAVEAELVLPFYHIQQSLE
jgi:hypothetical protein